MKVKVGERHLGSQEVGQPGEEDIWVGRGGFLIKDPQGVKTADLQPMVQKSSIMYQSVQPFEYILAEYQPGSICQTE